MKAAQRGWFRILDDNVYSTQAQAALSAVIVVIKGLFDS